VTGPVTFTSANGEVSGAAPASVLGVCNSTGRVTHYRGKIEVRSESVGNRVVNDVKTEDYLRGVVPKEISASWADAGGGKGANAVRAQAVAARSYGLQQNRYVNEGGYASICDSQSCQVYFGSASRASASSSPVNVEDARTDAAIAATAGKVRKFPSGAVASTEFSASNGPRTAGGVFPPVDDVPGDGTSRNPNHRWTRVLDADTLGLRYGLGRLTSATMVEAASSVNRQFDGIWFNDVVLTGTSGSVRVPAWTSVGERAAVARVHAADRHPRHPGPVGGVHRRLGRRVGCRSLQLRAAHADRRHVHLGGSTPSSAAAPRTSPAPAPAGSRPPVRCRSGSTSWSSNSATTTRRRRSPGRSTR
jgi:hypothetical protein